MKSRPEYDAAVAIVREVIAGWDPFALIVGDARPDEFDHEVARIVARIPHIHSHDGAATEISAIFSKAFDAAHFSVTDCRAVGATLYDRLAAAGLVQA